MYLFTLLYTCTAHTLTIWPSYPGTKLPCIIIKSSKSSKGNISHYYYSTIPLGSWKNCIAAGSLCYIIYSLLVHLSCVFIKHDALSTTAQLPVGAFNSIHTALLELYTTKHQVRTTRKTNYLKAWGNDTKNLFYSILSLKTNLRLDYWWTTDGLSIDTEFLNFYITVLSTNLLI